MIEDTIPACKWYIYRWPKSLFKFYHNIIWKNPNILFGQPSIS